MTCWKRTGGGENVRQQTQKIARFGLLTALALILGLLDRAIPVSALLGGVLPGIKLGLANSLVTDFGADYAD